MEPLRIVWICVLVLVLTIQSGLAYLSLRTGLELAKGKPTAEGLPLVTIIVAPTVALTAALTPVTLELIRALLKVT